ncbi:MAG: TonB-dependent receptor plug domain-containing protein [Oligoflexales bacterium]|nr:TonB-dependent receptor plug domain-containing protein [Oligoflexales bacterium]
MKTMPIFVALFLSFLCIVPAYSQEAQDKQEDQTQASDLVFIIREKGSGKLLKRVEIRTDNDVYYSDPKGNATVPNGPGITKFEFYRSGYSSLTLTKDEISVSETNEIFLYPDVKQNRVVVTGRGKKQVSEKQVSITEAKEVAPRGDPVQIAKLLPGVQTSGFSPEVVVRGSAPEDSSYFVDGIEVPFIFHSIGGISILPKNIIEKVNFLSGGFGPSYGNATGGVVVIETSEELAKEPKTEFTVNLPLLSSIYHERPISEEESMSASVRRSYLEYFIKNIAEDSLIVPIFYDSHLRYLKVTDEGYTKVISLSSLDALELVFGGKEDEEGSGTISFDIRNYFGAIGLERSMRLGNGWRYVSSPNIVYSHIDQRFVDNFIDIKANVFKFPVEFQKRIGKKKKLFLGIEGMYQTAKVSLVARRITTDDPFVDFEDAPLVETEIEAKAFTGAAWTSADLGLGPVTITPGLRVFNDAALKKNGFDPRLLILWEAGSETEVKAAVGQYSASPLPQESAEDFGNPDLDFERSNHYIIGINQSWGLDWSTEFQLYYKQNRDVVRSDPVERYLNSGQLISRGAEVFVRKNLTDRWFGWLSYTYSKTEEKQSDDAPWLPSQYDQTHVLNLVSAYNLTGQWTIGGRLNYHTGDVYTPVNGAVYNAGLNKYQPRYDENKVNGERLPNWHQLDIYTSYEQLFDYSKLKYRVGIEYISAEKPTYQVTYNYDYSKKDFVRGLPPIPYFEISGEF